MGNGTYQLRWVDGESVTFPLGFLAGAVYAGIKTPGPGKLDVGAVLSDSPCAAAGTFTRNKVAAAPVVVSRERVKRGSARGIVFNAGNANAATGEDGLRAARQMTELAAGKFRVSPEDLLVASTGIIGVPLPMEKIADGFDRVELRPDGGSTVARAIMTTDTRPKEAAVEVSGEGWSFRIGAAAKGAGMIHPNMATMFCFITSDAQVDPVFLDDATRRGAELSFNMISIDGDTSTNDTVFVLANGRSGAPRVAAGSPTAAAFTDALTQVCVRMAKAIAFDGEGATKLIEVRVEGGRTEKDARLAARAVASSNLLKAAVAGGDPNWGRIACAAGYSGADLEESKLDITIAGHAVLRHGRVLEFDARAASEAMRGPDVLIEIALNLGEGTATAWGCDLTEEYVVVNSKYTT